MELGLGIGVAYQWQTSLQVVVNLVVELLQSATLILCTYHLLCM